MGMIKAVEAGEAQVGGAEVVGHHEDDGVNGCGIGGGDQQRCHCKKRATEDLHLESHDFHASGSKYGSDCN